MIESQVQNLCIGEYESFVYLNNTSSSNMQETAQSPVLTTLDLSSTSV